MFKLGFLPRQSGANVVQRVAKGSALKTTLSPAHAAEAVVCLEPAVPPEPAGNLPLNCPVWVLGASGL